MGVCQEGDLTAEGGERRFGCRGWVPVCTGTTSGCRGWVPVCTGTTVWLPGMGSRLHGNDGLAAGDGFPFARERRFGSRGWVPVARERRLGSRGWVPVCTGTTVWLPRMGSRLHGNDGWGAGDGFPLSRERRWWVAGFFTPHLPAGGHVGQLFQLIAILATAKRPKDRLSRAVFVLIRVAQARSCWQMARYMRALMSLEGGHSGRTWANQLRNTPFRRISWSR